MKKEAKEKREKQKKRKRREILWEGLHCTIHFGGSPHSLLFITPNDPQFHKEKELKRRKQQDKIPQQPQPHIINPLSHHHRSSQARIRHTWPWTGSHGYQKQA